MLWINRFVGVALIALTIPLWRESGDYPEMARLFPRAMLIVIAFLSAIMIVRSFIPAVAPVREGEGLRTRPAITRPLIIFGLLVVAVVASDSIGFFTTMIVMTALLIPILGIRKWKSYAIACLLLMLFVYVLFVIFLDVPLTSVRLPGF